MPPDPNDSPAAIFEDVVLFGEQKIGYCRYGIGPYFMLFIPGGVGSYAKDYPPELLRAFDPSLVTVVAIDPPGYGKSRPPDRKQEINRCMKDAPFCIKLMQHLNLTPFTVVGWSEGGRTAIHVTGQGKSLVKNMVILGASTRVDKRYNQVFRGLRNFDHWMEPMRQSFLQHYDHTYCQVQWAAMSDMVNEAYEFTGGRFPSDYILPTIKIPVLLLHGGNDSFCVQPKYFCEVMPQAKLVVYANGGHDFYLKATRFFAENIQQFICDPSGFREKCINYLR